MRAAGEVHEDGRQPGDGVVPYLQWLIRKDRKLTALKDLQGLIWAEGYANGTLQGPLYADVPPALQHWHQSGLVLAVYSSGSVRAQQLIYQHSTAGDLSGLFSAWFDTNIGVKHSASSYQTISKILDAAANHILFISDSLAELDAASTAGLQVLHCDRAPSSSSGSAANNQAQNCQADHRKTGNLSASIPRIDSFDALHGMNGLTSNGAKG